MSRLKPSFFLLGPSKTGTTSVFYTLKQHPQIEAPFRKEILFFAHRYRKGIDWYLDRFPKDDGTGKITFESTPGYFAHWMTPHRMRSEGFKDAKFIIFLRNPTERFISHYRHFRSYNLFLQKEHCDIPDYVINQIKKDPNWTGESRSFQQVINNPSTNYYKDGEYIIYLKLWFELFPRDQFLILDFRDLKNDFGGVVSKIENFLEIDQFAIDRVNINTREQWDEWRGVEQITEEDIEYLDNYFYPYNQALYNFLGWDFKWEEDNIII